MNAESKRVAEDVRVPMDPFLANLLLEVDAKGKELAAAGLSNDEISLILAKLLNEKAPFLQVIVQAGTLTISYTAEDENRPSYPSRS